MFNIRTFLGKHTDIFKGVFSTGGGVSGGIFSGNNFWDEFHFSREQIIWQDFSVEKCLKNADKNKIVRKLKRLIKNRGDKQNLMLAVLYCIFLYYISPFLLCLF